MSSKRFLSGVQPSGTLHLGNYFGAIRQHLARQDNAFYFIADYHALTTVQDADTLRRNVFDVAATYLALGLDPSRACLFRQSDVPEVTELTWLLLTVTPMGLLERAVSYKDKIGKGLPASAGLFTYPVLMAADILAYESEVVPVGPDQRQHVEMTQDMAEAFNRAYGPVFKRPEYELGTPTSVPGVDGAKMSKSYNNYIPIFAAGKELKKLVMGIKTDSKEVEEPKDPETCNVFALYALFADDTQKAQLSEKYRAGGMGYGEAKKSLLGLIEAHFADARAKKAELDAHPEQVEAALTQGAEKARKIAQEVLHRARKAAGLGR